MFAELWLVKARNALETGPSEPMQSAAHSKLRRRVEGGGWPLVILATAPGVVGLGKRSGW
jgi:hypothetical protein